MKHIAMVDTHGGGGAPENSFLRGIEMKSLYEDQNIGIMPNKYTNSLILEVKMQDNNETSGFVARTSRAQNDAHLSCHPAPPLCHPEFISGSQEKITKRFRLGGRNDENGGLNDEHLLRHPEEHKAYKLTRLTKFVGSFCIISGSQKCGFTLAEVLITLGVIGVVAAMTLPTVINNVQSRIRAEQIRSAKYKFTQATDKMNSLGLIVPYDSTEAFVNELKKHLKIAKVCKSNAIEGCWPTKEVKLNAEGDLFEISKVITGKQFKMETNDKNDYTSPNIGIVTADGTPMIISYNLKCEPLDPVKQYGWTTDNNKPVSNATAGCVAAVMDINGSKKPNKLGEDVVLFNAKGLGSGCGMEIAGKCLSTLITSYAPLTNDECEAQKNTLGIKNCYGLRDNDYWAGAVAACGHVDKMVTKDVTQAIAKIIYNTSDIKNLFPDTGLTYNKIASEKLLGLTRVYDIWSKEEIDPYRAGSRSFSETWTEYGYFQRARTGHYAICVMD